MARKFFYVCAGMLILALSFHFGFTTATAQALAAMQARPVTAQATKPMDVPDKFRGLVALCGRDDGASRLLSGGYIMGFVDGSQATQEAAVVETVARQIASFAIAPTDSSMDAASDRARRDQRLFCVLSNWTVKYVQAVVGQYAREHPESLNDESANHMLEVLAKAFPCEK